MTSGLIQGQVGQIFDCLSACSYDPAKDKLKSADALDRLMPDRMDDPSIRILRQQRLLRENSVETLRKIDIAIDVANERIPFAVIKGLSFEQCCYGGAPFRDVGDLDLLVASENCEKFHKILLNMGYKQRVGPSSANGSKGRSYAAIVASSWDEAADGCNYPIRRRPFKQELSPYVKEGFPSIEVHDGFAYLPRWFVEDVIKDSTDNWLHLVRNPIGNLVFLLLNTYENSESFYSNAFDYGVVLRDYVDLRNFFYRNVNLIDWQEAETLLENLGITDKAAVVLGNLEELYGDRVIKGVLSTLDGQASTWDANIGKRIVDEQVARRSAMRLFRRRLREVTTDMAPYSFERPLAIGDSVGFSLVSDGKVLFVNWTIPKALFDERHYWQLNLFPLEDKCDFLVYRVGLGLFGGSIKASGHWSRRFMQGAAVKRLSGDELSIRLTCDECNAHVEVCLPTSLIKHINAGCVASPAVYELNHGNVFWDTDILSKHILDDVSTSHLIRYGQTGFFISAVFSFLEVSISIDDENLVKRLLEVFPNSVRNVIVGTNKAYLRLAVKGVGSERYSVYSDGHCIGHSLTEKSACYLLMQAISDTLYSLMLDDEHMLLHASAIRLGDDVIVFMGPSGCGKTTLALACAEFAVLMGDECVSIDPKTGLAFCEEFPILIKEGNFAAFGYCRSCEEGFLQVEGGPHGPAAYCSRDAFACDDAPTRDGYIRAIVFPKYREDFDASIKPLAEEEFVDSVLASLMSTGSQSQSLKRFVRMVSGENIDVCSIEYGDCIEAAKELKQFFLKGKV